MPPCSHEALWHCGLAAGRTAAGEPATCSCYEQHRLRATPHGSHLPPHPAQTMLPDAGNQPAFPAPVLRPGQEYRNQAVWRLYQV